MPRSLTLLATLALLSLPVAALAQEAEAKKPVEQQAPLALVEYELTIVHLSLAEGEEQQDFVKVDLPAVLKSWQEQGRIKWTKSMRLAACDNQSAYVQFGEKKAIPTGSNVGPRGRANSYQYEDVGLILGITGRVEPDQSITAELDIKHSDLEVPAVDAPSNGETVDFVPAETHTNQIQTTVRLQSGQTMLVGSGEVDSPDARSLTLLFVSAKIVK